MSCEEIRKQVDARLHGELSEAETQRFDDHLVGCAECRGLLERRTALRETLKREMGSFEAPADLRKLLVTAARDAQVEVRAIRPIRPSAAWWIGVAAALAIVAIGSWQLGARRSDGALMSEVVLESHVRSLLGQHLTDVTSTDQHTVKPWFNGKLDFSPPVSDFVGQGYPLLGGRLEYLGGKQVAALVYERRKHLINVFLWPTAAGNSAGRASGSMNGYHLLHWTRPDFTYWIVSDLGEAELEEFSGLLQQTEARR